MHGLYVVHLDAGLGKGGNQLANIDVHAATVAGARLGKGRCVEG